MALLLKCQMTGQLMVGAVAEHSLNFLVSLAHATECQNKLTYMMNKLTYMYLVHKP